MLACSHDAFARSQTFRSEYNVFDPNTFNLLDNKHLPLEYFIGLRVMAKTHLSSLKISVTLNFVFVTRPVISDKYLSGSGSGGSLTR